MDISGIGSVIVSLGVVLLLLAGFAFFFRWLSTKGLMPRIASGLNLPSSNRSCRIGRGCTLTIVTLDGVKFAVLNGAHSDQFMIIPEIAGQTIP